MKPTLDDLINLVGNRKVYAVQHDDGSWHPVRESITKGLLRRHLDGDITIGTYLVTPSGTAKTLVFDLDSGDAAEHQSAALHSVLRLFDVPDSAIGIEDSGRKGLHVWVLAPGYVPAEELRRLGAAVQGSAALDCEVFPKQSEVKDLGNLVKLPGGIHRMTGNHNDFIGPVPVPMSEEQWAEVMEGVPEVQLRSNTIEPAPYPCMEAAQDGPGEGCRNIMLFHLATMCRTRGLNSESTELVVRAANEKCDPPLDERELTSLLSSSLDSGPICGQVPQQYHCGEKCIAHRSSLSTRPKQVRYATEDEHVVLRVKKRRGKVVEFEHEDLDECKGVLHG